MHHCRPNCGLLARLCCGSLSGERRSVHQQKIGLSFGLGDYFPLAICETARVMVALAPDVRSRFATRLKRLRLQRGFERARFFARTLGIEENRYTRYERAEVEPSLTLLHKMCDTLRVTPNELLGFAEPTGEISGPTDACAACGEGEGNRADPTSSLAWRLASATVAIRQEYAGRKAAGDALETIRETGNLFAELQAKPFGAVAEIARDPSLKSAAPEKRAALAELIRCYTDRVATTVGPRPR
jgi:transcriptional regulator with XRE-family HTH domain